MFNTHTHFFNSHSPSTPFPYCDTFKELAEFFSSVTFSIVVDAFKPVETMIGIQAVIAAYIVHFPTGTNQTIQEKIPGTTQDMVVAVRNKLQFLQIHNIQQHSTLKVTLKEFFTFEALEKQIDFYLVYKKSLKNFIASFKVEYCLPERSKPLKVFKTPALVLVYWMRNPDWDLTNLLNFMLPALKIPFSPNQSNFIKKYNLQEPEQRQRGSIQKMYYGETQIFFEQLEYIIRKFMDDHQRAIHFCNSITVQYMLAASQKRKHLTGTVGVVAAYLMQYSDHEDVNALIKDKLPHFIDPNDRRGLLRDLRNQLNNPEQRRSKRFKIYQTFMQTLPFHQLHDIVTVAAQSCFPQNYASPISPTTPRFFDYRTSSEKTDIVTTAKRISISSMIT